MNRATKTISRILSKGGRRRVCVVMPSKNSSLWAPSSYPEIPPQLQRLTYLLSHLWCDDRIRPRCDGVCYQLLPISPCCAHHEGYLVLAIECCVVCKQARQSFNSVDLTMIILANLLQWTTLGPRSIVESSSQSASKQAKVRSPHASVCIQIPQSGMMSLSWTCSRPLSGPDESADILSSHTQAWKVR